MKILIIEDDPVQALNLKIQLTALGYEDIDTASNLESVQRAVGENDYDLALCDIQLPDVDGISLLSQYLNPDVVKSVIIVSVVDNGIIQLTQGICNQIGYLYVGALQKPFVREQLVTEIRHYDKHMGATKPVVEDILVSEQDILTGFEQGRFFSVYQPQFSFTTGRLLGLEALVRFDHAQYGTLTPQYFLHLIQSMGLMKQLYVLMLDKGTAALTTLGHQVRLSFNISQDLLDLDLCDITAKICEVNEYPLSKLTLEITEEQARNSSYTALANIARLRLLGVHFSIDDFGTGYASLEQLVDIPFSELKIDRLFISRARQDYKHQQLTVSILRLAQSLGLNCVAEGVEDLDTWEYLKELGVDICQGYFTGTPMSISELLPLYMSETRTTAGEMSVNQNVIVLVDKDMVRGWAKTRLLEKRLSQHSIVFLSKLDELYNTVRDLPVSLVILENESLHELHEHERVIISNTKQKVETLVLMARETKAVNSFSSPQLVKSEGINETVDSIVKYIDELAAAVSEAQTAPLSERETEVAKLLLAGFSNKYIGYELGISHKTVSTLKMRIFTKLGIKSLVELAGKLSSTPL